jgi:hypothetical protein
LQHLCKIITNHIIELVYYGQKYAGATKKLWYCCTFEFETIAE